MLKMIQKRKTKDKKNQEISLLNSKPFIFPKVKKKIIY